MAVPLLACKKLVTGPCSGKRAVQKMFILLWKFIYHLIIRHQYNIVRKKGQIQSIEAYDTEMITIWLQKLS